MMTGILITGGEKPSADRLKKIVDDEWMIAAADSGIEWALSEGINLSLVLGDMDSLTDESVLKSLDDNIIFRFPVDKDHTDTEIGLKMLQERGCRRTIVWGAGGGRMDHFLAVYSLFERENPPTEWYTGKEHMVFIDRRFSGEGLKDKRISLFPLGCGECRMKSRGLKWPLDELVWNRGDFGISNFVSGERMEINMVKGKLLMIYDIDKGNRS